MIKLANERARISTVAVKNLLLAFMPHNNTSGHVHARIHLRSRKYSINSVFCGLPKKFVRIVWHLGDDSQRSRKSQLEVRI